MNEGLITDQTVLLGAKLDDGRVLAMGAGCCQKEFMGFMSLQRSLSQLIYLGGEWVDLCLIKSTVCRSFSVTFSSLWVSQRPSNSLTDAHKQEKGLLKQSKCQTKPYKLKIQKQKPSLRILAKCLEDNNSNVVELPSKSPDHKLKENVCKELKERAGRRRLQSWLSYTSAVRRNGRNPSSLLWAACGRLPKIWPKLNNIKATLPLECMETKWM